MATSFKLQALTGVRLTDSIRSKSYYVYIHKLWEFAVPSVCPFIWSNFISCLHYFWRLIYVNYHAFIHYDTQFIDFDGFYLQCNPQCTIFRRLWCRKNLKSCPAQLILWSSKRWFSSWISIWISILYLQESFRELNAFNLVQRSSCLHFFSPRRQYLDFS